MAILLKLQFGMFSRLTFSKATIAKNFVMIIGENLQGQEALVLIYSHTAAVMTSFSEESSLKAEDLFNSNSKT